MRYGAILSSIPSQYPCYLASQQSIGRNSLGANAIGSILDLAPVFFCCLSRRAQDPVPTEKESVEIGAHVTVVQEVIAMQVLEEPGF